MRSKFKPWYFVLLALILLGIGLDLYANPGMMLIPVIVFGAVFLLYKFPPARARSAARHESVRTKERSQERSKSKQRNRKSVPFRVIDGGKDDDNLPKYH
jgi:hypothetical protein